MLNPEKVDAFIKKWAHHVVCAAETETELRADLAALGLLGLSAAVEAQKALAAVEHARNAEEGAARREGWIHYDELEPRPTLEQMVAAGYRRVSNAYAAAARVDRADWQEQVLAVNPVILLGAGRGADHYRRCFSKDTVRGIPFIRQLPSSDFDPVGFIQADGTPHPGYEVRLIARGSER